MIFRTLLACKLRTAFIALVKIALVCTSMSWRSGREGRKLLTRTCWNVCARSVIWRSLQCGHGARYWRMNKMPMGVYVRTEQYKKIMAIAMRGNSNSWKGDKTTKPHTGRQRARKLFCLKQRCELCPARAVERHHKDGNPFNNKRRNIQSLCRRCHMKADGRLAKLQQMQKKNALRNIKLPTPCVNCGRVWKPLRHGRCYRCRDYFEYHGKERPPLPGPQKPYLSRRAV